MSGINTPGGDILSKQLLDLLLQTNDSNVATFGNASNNVIMRVYDNNLPYAPKSYQFGIYANDSLRTSNSFFITANTPSLTRVGFGTLISDTAMEIIGTDALLIPKGTTTQRPNPKKGHIRYNTELDLFEGYGTGETWVPFGGVKNRDQSAKIDAEFTPGSLDNNLRFTTCNQERMRILPTGNIGIGTTTPKVIMEINSRDAVLIPQGTSIQRPTSTHVQKGMIRFNTDTQQFEGYGAGDTWGSLGGVKSTDQTTYISAEESAGANDSNLRFFTGNNQHMIITNQGLIGIGTTTPQTKLHMIGDLIVTGTVEAGAYGSLYRVADTYATVPLSNISPQNLTRTVLTNDPNPSSRILYSFETTGGRFLVNGCIPYRNKSSLVAFNTTNWASISLYRLDIIPNTNPVQYAPFTSSTPAIQIAPMNIQTDEREYATHNINFFVQNVYPARYVIAVSGKGHELEFGGPVSDTSIFVIPIRGLGYEDSYDVRRAIQLSPIRFTSNVPTNTPLSLLQYTIPGNLIPTGTSNVSLDMTVFIDGYKDGKKLTGTEWDRITDPFPPTTNDFYWYLDNVLDVNQSKVIATNTTIGFSNITTTGTLDFTIWPTVTSSNVFQTGYFYQNAVRLGKIRIDNVKGNIGISSNVSESMPLSEYSLYVEGDTFTTGTIYASNLTILGDAVTLNTVTSNTEQIVITNAGTGPALTVTQTGPQPIADFYDDGGIIAMRIADGGNIGIGTFPRQRLDVQGPAAIFSDTLGIGTTTPRQRLDVHGAPAIFIDANVGIGTTTPRQLFHIHGASAIFMQANVGIGTITPRKFLDVQDGEVIFSHNLGIGTTAPRQLLDVQGGKAIFSHDIEIGRDSILIGNIGIGTTFIRNHLHLTGQFTISNPSHQNNETSYYNSVYQWSSATFNQPSSYNTNIIRQDNASINPDGFIPPLILYNAHGGNNTTTGLTFASAEVSGSVSGKNSVTIAGIMAHKLAGTAGSWATGAMTLFTKNNSTRTDAIHIIQNGNVGIGTTTQLDYKLRVEGKTLINNDLLVTGDITGFYQLSDRRLKQNIQTIPSALDQITRLRPVTFQWSDSVQHLNKRGTHDVGLIAQEVRPYFPLVTEENMQFPSEYSDLMGIQYPKLIPYLIRSIQELNEKIKTLESRLP